jgi:hypothetical protein
LGIDEASSITVTLNNSGYVVFKPGAKFVPPNFNNNLSRAFYTALPPVAKLSLAAKSLLGIEHFKATLTRSEGRVF